MMMLAESEESPPPDIFEMVWNRALGILTIVLTTLSFFVLFFADSTPAADFHDQELQLWRERLQAVPSNFSSPSPAPSLTPSKSW